MLKDGFTRLLRGELMTRLPLTSPHCPPTYNEEWANSLGYGPTQGAIGKNGAGKGKGKDYKGGGGKGYGGGYGGGSGGKDQNGKDGGKGDRPVGACSHCWGFGHYYRACPVRLGPEAAAQAEKDYAIAVSKGDKGKGKGKGKKGKGKGEYGKGVYGVEGDRLSNGDDPVHAACRAHSSSSTTTQSCSSMT